MAVVSSPTLAQALVGAWLLESYVETDVETGEVRHPLGTSPLGIILYTPDGHMSAQLQARDRAPFADNDMYGGTPDEHVAAGRTYIAYSGRFTVDEATRTLSHEVAVSLFPNWRGQVQVRVAELDNGRLHLSTDGPQRVRGSSRTARLTWVRAPAST